MELIITVINISTWWSSLDVNYQTVIISGGISLLILGLGCAISEVIRRRTKSIELTQYKQFIEEWITESRKTLDQYISCLEKLSNDIKNNKSLDFPKVKSNIINVSEIYKIPLERYADIYIFGIDSKNRKEKRIQLMDFLYELEYLEKATSLIMDRYNDYSKHNEEMINEWNKCHMNLKNLYITINYKDKPEAKKLCYSFFHAIENAVKESSRLCYLEIWDSEYLTPTINFLKKENPSPGSLLFQIALYTRDLNDVKNKHYDSNKYSEVFAGYANDLKNSRDVIDNFKSYFEDKKIKRFCK